MRQEMKRRNNCNQPIQVTRDFDRATGTRFKPLKSTCATPTRQMQHTAEQFGMKIVTFEKKVKYPVTDEGNRDRRNQNKRTDEATRTVASIARLPRGLRPVRASLKQMQSRDTNFRLSPRHKSCALCNRHEQT